MNGMSVYANTVHSCQTLVSTSTHRDVLGVIVVVVVVVVVLNNVNQCCRTNVSDDIHLYKQSNTQTI